MDSRQYSVMLVSHMMPSVLYNKDPSVPVPLKAVMRPTVIEIVIASNPGSAACIQICDHYNHLGHQFRGPL